MNRLRYLFLFVVFAAHSSYAQCGGAGTPASVTNAGNEFLLCFQENAISGPGDDIGYLEIYLAALEDSATVTISSRAFPARTVQYRLAPRETKFHRETDDLRIVGSERVDDRVVRVHATKPIICYGMNHKRFTADAFLALPRQTASTEYRVMTYYNTPGSGAGDETAAQFVVAAYEDNTQVRIIPSATTLLGRPRGTLMEWTLDSGQCVQIQGDPLLTGQDLTGSRITSSKPVAVYAGHVCAEVPLGSDLHGLAQSCDHLTESMPPVNVWGQTFVTSNFVSRNLTDRVRVLALNDNTTVSIMGDTWTLNAGEFRDTLMRRAIAIEASGPVLVGTYARTSASVNASDGDPFFAIVPPLDQTYTEFPFYASSDPGYDGNYVIVVTEQSGKDMIFLDGIKIPATSFADVPALLNGKQYSHATVQVQPGPHFIKTNATAENGINILAYGFGSFDSYGYTAGALLKPLRGLIEDKHFPPTFAQSQSGGITVRNILNERVYFDSAVVKTSDGGTIRIEENLSSRFGILDVDQSLVFHIANESGKQIDGEVLLYAHSADWMDLLPTRIPFTTKQLASVEKLADLVTVYPNPAIDRISISGVDGITAVTFVDDLGIARRTVRREGNRDVDLQGLAPGHYTILVNAAGGVQFRTQLIIR